MARVLFFKKKNLLFVLVVFLLYCNDKVKQNTEYKTTSDVGVKQDTVSISSAKQTKKDSILELENSMVLNDKNAMEFFLHYDLRHKEQKVRIYTSFGNIDILLFNETKFHRSNFIYLTKKGYFDGTQFYRIVKNFVIQGGNSDDYRFSKRRRSIGRYLLPPDTKRGFKHHRGAVSMPSAEIENPYKLASPFEFFITQSNQYHLDGNYTVFGKVIKGMDVVDKISEVETDESEWPLQNVYINKVEILD